MAPTCLIEHTGCLGVIGTGCSLRGTAEEDVALPLLGRQQSPRNLPKYDYRVDG
jgi:hypothetical protein